ncbi:MAG: ABC transporter permease [Oscillospiraceae bacterium]|jgi:ABC-2 type transport system permease protein|nr:ABC transporter permease [Oscillospiraceae bacterium]
MKTKGWSNVLRFTYLQTVRSKSFIISNIVIFSLLLLMMAGVNFLPKLIGSEAEKDTIQIDDGQGNIIEAAAFKIEKVYILDKSGVNPDFSFLTAYKVEYEFIGEDKLGQTMNTVAAGEKPETLLVIERDETGMFTLTMDRPDNADLVKNSDCNSLLNFFYLSVKNANYISLGVSAGDLYLADAPIITKVTVNGEEPPSEIARYMGMMSTMVTSLILFMLIIMYGQLTAQSIATEKTSRVLELLLTSIKPLAVIIGKVLAMMLVVITQVAAIFSASAILFMIFAPAGTLGEIFGMVETDDVEVAMISQGLRNTFADFGASQILLIVLIFILGFLFYSLIAGLIGASISRIEDLQTAMQPMAIISVLGFYLSYFTPMMGMNEDGGNAFLTKLSYYLPISSPFALPGAIMSGEIGADELTVAIGVLAASVALFAMFVAKVYESIILYTGNRLKIKDMIKMAKR